jgi:hypothetical protein
VVPVRSVGRIAAMNVPSQISRTALGLERARDLLALGADLVHDKDG